MRLGSAWMPTDDYVLVPGAGRVVHFETPKVLNRQLKFLQ